MTIDEAVAAVTVGGAVALGPDWTLGGSLTAVRLT